MLQRRVRSGTIAFMVYLTVAMVFNVSLAIFHTTALQPLMILSNGLLWGVLVIILIPKDRLQIFIAAYSKAYLARMLILSLLVQVGYIIVLFHLLPLVFCSLICQSIPEFWAFLFNPLFVGMEVFIIFTLYTTAYPFMVNRK